MVTETDRIKLIFVDDEERILKSLKRLFLDEPYEVLTATSGEDGISLIQEHPDVAVIVSDQRMPQMLGADFLAHAREKAPDALRIILTGYADITAAMDAINKGGAFRYITKPWQDEDLLLTIREAANHFRLIRENRMLNALVNKQNEELKEWNTNLKQKIMERTAVIRAKNDELTQTLQGVIEAFSRLVELCGGQFHNHSRNVTELSVNIARDMGLPEVDVENVRIAALLHDIGIIGIPEDILSRVGSLNIQEQRIFQQHSVRGQTAIDAVGGLREVGKIIRHHHEHLNGNGYPDGLIGSDIPLGSRIIGVADFVDRTIGDQRGQKAVEAVMEAAIIHQGVMLDPEAVKHARRFVQYHYFSGEKTRLAGTEAEYHVDAVTEGLQLTRDLYSGTGLLLLNKGTILDSTMIKSIRRYYDIDPPSGGIYATIAGA